MPLLWNLPTGSISGQPIDLISPLRQQVYAKVTRGICHWNMRPILQIGHAEKVCLFCLYVFPA